jgi:L-ascorbate metabolism protein UlaG (beta-lactamase superfamily)
MLISHGHEDHMGDAVALARKHQPDKTVASFEVCQWLAKQGVESVSAMNVGGSQDVLGMTVSMVRADHSSSISDGERLLYGGPAAGFMVRLPDGYTFYFAGDTGLFLDMQLLGDIFRPELAFLPIGDVYTMGPHMAARACRRLGVHRVVPMHWGTFPELTGTPDELLRELADLGVDCEMIALRPGEVY